MLAHTMGRPDLAREHFDRALDKNRAMGAWPALARTQAWLARVLLSSETDAERDYGKQLIGEAEQLASRFNMTALGAEISEILQDGASQLPDGLTPREVDVLKLLAIGRSNKDISMALAISLSTVATHIRSILTKAGCANRTEAAAYAMRHELS
jgi:DNA-binding NarL/FixJ family response regulator